MTAAYMMVRLLLPEESVIGGAAVVVWGKQRGDVGVCSWEVEGLVWERHGGSSDFGEVWFGNGGVSPVQCVTRCQEVDVTFICCSYENTMHFTTVM